VEYYYQTHVDLQNPEKNQTGDDALQSLCLLGMLLDCKEQERAIVKGYCEVKKFFFIISATREKLWQEFFMDPSQWEGHRSDKVSEHQTSQSPNVNGVPLLVSILLLSLGCCLTQV
jgi:hypothetical protein